ncbi:MAG TPA: glycosyltransferase family 39 protein [Mycobacteriales bacterium]|nr:glycosyltransferase family 39 protein [Mycobacteriales bacterium]
METVVAAATATAFIGRKNFWLDEGYSFVGAHRSLSSMVHVVLHDRGVMGLYYVALHFWLALGRTEGVIRLLSVPAAVATVPVVAELARRLAGRRTALVAGALCAVNPMVVQYAQEARAYSLVLLVAASSALLFTACVSRPRITTAVSWAVVSAAGFYAHSYIALLVVAELASLLLLPRGRRPRVLLPAAVGFGVLIAPLLIAVLAVRGHLPDAHRFSLLDPGRLIYAFSGSIPLAVLAVVLLAVAAVQTYRSMSVAPERRWESGFPWVMLVLPAAVALAMSLVHPAWRERYLIVSLPAFLILVARAVRGLTIAWLRPTAVVVLVALSAVAVGGYYAGHVKAATDWRAASSYALRHAARGDALWFVPATGYVPFDYYQWRDRAAGPHVLGLPADPLRSSIHPRVEPLSRVRSEAATQQGVCTVLLAPNESVARQWFAQRVRTVRQVLGPRLSLASVSRFGPLLRVVCFRRSG